MTFSPTEVASHSDTTFSKAVTIPLTAAVPAGTRLIVAAAASGNANTLTITDSVGDVYTSDFSASTGAASYTTLAIASTVTTGLTTTDTLSLALVTGSPSIVLAWAVPGVGATSGSESGTGFSNSYSTAALAANSGDFLLAVVAADDTTLASEFTPGTGWTELVGLNGSARGMGAQWKQSAGGSETGPASVVNTHEWIEGLVAYPATVTSTRYIWDGTAWVPSTTLLPDGAGGWA